ncbi:MAG: phosphohydrolase [Candidatus Riflebacteria bacterium HGW-Riflebacteria-1]|jgi:HD-GYP domain-containing protein (c-di-GMP phosphodiesterase class II)|nr:MAG: phosphohydrolase [Candidatus Riflebacteria bacterium HGW-Riflebacteria-1]
MKPQYRLNLFDFLSCLSDILDWISPMLNDHHKQVALIAMRIADALELPAKEQSEIVCAGILHDIGAISLAERMETLKFEYTTGQAHAEMGYHLINIFNPMRKAAELIRFHHVFWNNGEGRFYKGLQVPLGSRILQLADRIALLIDRKKVVLSQADAITERIASVSGSMLEPQLVDIFMELAKKEYFWLDIVSPLINKQLQANIRLDTIRLNNAELLSFASLIRRMIDFRSPFTATHSSGVSATAEHIGILAGMDDYECFELKVAGYLHDLGKLAIPTEILEKPGQLSTDEFNQMRGHTFYTFRALESIRDLSMINQYGSYHHERLDGSGYPFGLERRQLPLGSRVLAVADVFTALTENRPYRKGMTNEQTILILSKMAENNKLDGEIVELVRIHHEEINKVRIKAQEDSRSEYRTFLENIG